MCVVQQAISFQTHNDQTSSLKVGQQTSIRFSNTAIIRCSGIAANDNRVWEAHAYLLTDLDSALALSVADTFRYCNEQRNHLCAAIWKYKQSRESLPLSNTPAYGIISYLEEA